MLMNILTYIIWCLKMIENSLEGFIAVRDILLLAPAEEIVTMFNTEKCHNNSMEEMNSYILQQCKLRLGKRLTLEYMYDYKSLKETLLELMEYDADLLNSLKNRSLFINENNLFKILSSTAYMVTNFKENLENDNILSFIREETTTITNVLAIAKKTKMLTKELYKSGIEITDYINKEIKVPKIKQL